MSEEDGGPRVDPDLPTDRESATWEDCVDVVADTVGGDQRHDEAAGEPDEIGTGHCPT